MIRIRLSRVGRKHLPVYRVAVYESTTRRDGPFVENLGQYDPRSESPKDKFHLNEDRLKYWLQKGARPTPALQRLLKHAGVSTATR